MEVQLEACVWKAS